MAEWPKGPAVLARGWRSRPGVVRAAAVLLGLFGLVLVLVEGDQGDLDTTELLAALVLVSAAGALVWAGRVGYWVGLTVAALVAVLLVMVLARHPGVAGVVVTAICFLPLVLLVVPAARRPRPTAKPVEPSAAPARPQGWTRPFLGGWGEFAFMVIVGLSMAAGGLVMAVTGRGAERGAGAAIALFFLACVLAAPLFAPGRRRGTLRLGTLRLGGRQERGILVPYSSLRMAMVLGATACLALAMLGFVVFADAFADDPGGSPWPVRMVGAVGAAFFGVGSFIAARRGRGRNWRLLLPVNRRLAADITLLIRALDVDPALLYEALRYYHQHPRARDELATQDGLARLEHGELTSPRLESL
jgi:hypothetical protein